MSILYTPFGEMWVEEASTVDISNITRFFTNQQYDKESGLYYYNARYYDPHLGSFLTPDPAMENLNHYNYCASNPIKYTDPTGLTMDYSNMNSSDGYMPSSYDDDDDYRPTESSNQSNTPSINYSNLPTTPTNPYYDHPNSDPTQNTPTNNNYRPTETSPLPEPEKKVDPTFFTQSQVDKFIKTHFPNYPKDGKSTSCNFTDLINALSFEFTKANNKAMTEADLEKAVKGIHDAGYLKSDASGNQIAKILNAGWGALGMNKGEWINGQSWLINYAVKNGGQAHTIGRLDDVKGSPSGSHYIYKSPDSTFYKDPLNGNKINEPNLGAIEYLFLKK